MVGGNYAEAIIGVFMDIEKLKVTIDKTETVENLWKIGEKIFAKNDNAVCVVTYLIERAYALGMKEIEKRIIPTINLDI
jgi:hypothetical protein